MLRQLVIALTGALAISSAFAAEPIAATPARFKWIAPWKPGMTLVYATEERTDTTKDGKQTRERSTVQTHIAIASQPSGFVQTWTDDSGTYTVVEGDKSKEPRLRAFSASLGGVSYDLDKDGNFVGVHDMAGLLPRLRSASVVLMTASMEETLAKQGASAEQRKKSTEVMGRMLDTMMTPAYATGLLSRGPSSYNGLVNLDVELGSDYEAALQVNNPAGGAPIPAKLTFAAVASENDPDDMFITYEQVVDGEKLGIASLALGEHVAGEKISAEDKAKLAAMSLRDEGLLVVNRKTGIVEMMETTRTSAMPDGTKKVERTRMRQVGGDHAHDWKDDGDAEGEAEGDA